MFPKCFIDKYLFLFVESYQRLEQLSLKVGFLVSTDSRLEYAAVAKNDVSGRAEAAESRAKPNSCSGHHQAANGMDLFANVLSTTHGFTYRRPKICGFQNRRIEFS
jgi:hypothetical protein